ncbi:hypothetical protein HU200_012294 [Digitaria exilis]|uniref:F-box domain-containing protein n=1 Tax=Digitaria exilis TaxID=1010633 RepID=A0A835FFN0_9POAL|nr:hypothetical protein HU200_012294 [Digitaria exilis]
MRLPGRHRRHRTLSSWGAILSDVLVLSPRCTHSYGSKIDREQRERKRGRRCRPQNNFIWSDPINLSIEYRHAEEESAAAAKTSDRWERIPPDAFTEILRRVPPIPRRRLRLVCKHWRSVIDDRTPTTKQARAMVLAFVASRSQRRAYLKLPRDASDRGVIMVGTCNGLLCFRLWHHDFLVANPVTGEELTVPPPWTGPRDTEYTQTTAYSFACHPETGLYRIVHVACHGRGRTLGAFKVFTLGERAWREVPVPVGTSCLSRCGLVSVGGATYWVAADANSVMSLDLKEERVVFVATLPVHVGPPVWMLDDGGRSTKNPPAWVLRCKVVDPGLELPQGIALPHFIHGEHVLTTLGLYGQVSLHACRLNRKRTHGGVVLTEDSRTICLYDGCHSLRTFAYVETTEPLALYGGNDCDIGDCEGWDWRNGS